MNLEQIQLTVMQQVFGFTSLSILKYISCSDLVKQGKHTLELKTMVIQQTLFLMGVLQLNLMVILMIQFNNGFYSMLNSVQQTTKYQKFKQLKTTLNISIKEMILLLLLIMGVLIYKSDLLIMTCFSKKFKFLKDYYLLSCSEKELLGIFYYLSIQRKDVQLSLTYLLLQTE